MEFEWDEEKARANFNKHDVSFDEAKTVFDDSLFLIFADEDHSIEEKRFIILGKSIQSRLLVVSFTERENRTRIITARKATPSERRNYEQEL